MVHLRERREIRIKYISSMACAEQKGEKRSMPRNVKKTRGVRRKLQKNKAAKKRGFLQSFRRERENWALERGGRKPSLKREGWGRPTRGKDARCRSQADLFAVAGARNKI